MTSRRDRAPRYKATERVPTKQRGPVAGRDRLGSSASTSPSATADSTHFQERAAEVLRESLTHFFETVCPDRQGVHVPIETSRITEREAQVECRVIFDLPDPLASRARFFLHHERGNVCEVVGGLEGEPVERFVCCIQPTTSDRINTEMGETVGSFVLGQIKSSVGRYALRHIDTLDIGEGPA